ncbi:YggS family pyridoxal phosphate enzyme [Alkalilimnicola ehrlichii]|uniref:Pyridoxal phosphate homeostasis protein n=1 Tax=Alkalilimnicola ehrlichii TaxID=351052 RepID=A0A3E0X1I9_9GAMM|nr:YggS family pyridoxal phosphate-dependent enzyme [Alkalilimnicola ehrlichii]RFA31199.1 YggS family pyridoxal phosphate enzyme [Alkalilimnicola ehrlichii]RFA39519.1 YggS family pyridoxal phosphate enzyme [Alkalilimnicola ehrlichii]
MTDISSRLTHVQERIRRAEQEAGRPAESVRLLAVSKTQPASAIRSAYANGQRAFGENYLQEALEKIEQLSDLNLEWHFIGPIQSNKTKAIAQHFDWVHSVDRERIVSRLGEQRPAELPPLNICLQVNIDAEASKAGVAPSQLPALAAAVAKQTNLKLRGLMAIPAPKSDFNAQRESFRRLAQLAESLKDEGHLVDTLSMGMSDDLEAAIDAGSTLVRIGSALFGPRQQK